MAFSTAQSLVDLGKAEAKDLGAVTWSEDDWIGYLNAATLAIVRKDSSAYLKISSLQLVAGSKQKIPSDGIEFSGLPYNMGTDGATPGAAILEEDFDTYGQVLPGWQTATASSVVKAVLRRDADRKTFYVYPPQPATGMGYAEHEYSARPPVIDIADIANPISLSDEYDNALFYYMMARAHGKEDPKADSSLIAGFMTMFLGELSGGANVE